MQFDHSEASSYNIEKRRRHTICLPNSQRMTDNKRCVIKTFSPLTMKRIYLTTSKSLFEFFYVFLNWWGLKCSDETISIYPNRKLKTSSTLRAKCKLTFHALWAKSNDITNQNFKSKQ